MVGFGLGKDPTGDQGAAERMRLTCEEGQPLFRQTGAEWVNLSVDSPEGLTRSPCSRVSAEVRIFILT